MQVVVESISNLERKIKVAVPADKINQAIKEKLAEVAKTANIKGFRKGKVPLEVVRMQYGNAIKADVLGELMRTTYLEAIEQENLRPAGPPQIKPLTEFAKDGAINDFEYEAQFEVYPDITLSDFSKITIEKLTAEVAEEDVNKMLEVIRKQQATWKAVNRESKLGDQVKIDFVGEINGEKFKGGEAKDMTIELGAKSMLPEFEEKLVGIKAGDQFKFDMTFPNDYHSDVAGKDVTFEVTVHNVLEPQLPEIDDSLAKKMRIEGGVEAMRNEVRKNMENMLQTSLTDKSKKVVMEELLKAIEVEVPLALIDMEIRNLERNFKEQLGNKNTSLNLPKHLFEEEAKKRVKLGLILSEIIKQQQIKPSSDKMKLKLESIASKYEHPEQLLQYYQANEQLMDQIESVVLEEQVVDYILSQADVHERKISYDEAVSPVQQKEE